MPIHWGQVNRNNLYRGITNCFAYFANDGPHAWTNQNNAFDNVEAYVDGNIGNNAYLNGCLIDSIIQGSDLVTNLTWVSGPLGNYYQPTNSPLINHGSTTAGNLGLYHFTTQTNQVKETNSVVDIGYHYVALDGYGNPIDTDGDGVPDYLEDANGDGVFDAGDLGNWLIGRFNGLSEAKPLIIFTPLK